MDHREYYRRHLPHWQPAGATFFITFRLKGSLPDEIIEALEKELPQRHQTNRYYPEEGGNFAKWDNLLDQSLSGPRWLVQHDIAGVVKEALHYRDAKEYDLFAYCIMPNHVHAVFEPLEQEDKSYLALNKIMQSLKRHTARRANMILNRAGAFWQDESYDHVIRDNREFERIVNYVLDNPVKAGLAVKWEDWPWTYCKE